MALFDVLFCVFMIILIVLYYIYDIDCSQNNSLVHNSKTKYAQNYSGFETEQTETPKRSKKVTWANPLTHVKLFH